MTESNKVTPVVTNKTSDTVIKAKQNETTVVASSETGNTEAITSTITTGTDSAIKAPTVNADATANQTTDTKETNAATEESENAA